MPLPYGYISLSHDPFLKLVSLLFADLLVTVGSTVIPILLISFFKCFYLSCIYSYYIVHVVFINYCFITCRCMKFVCRNDCNGVCYIYSTIKGVFPLKITIGSTKIKNKVK